MIRDTIIEKAKEWVDTPYHHHAKIKGVGVDCAMLVLAIAYESGLVSKEQYDNPPKYSSQWHIHNDEELLMSILAGFNCEEIPVDSIQPGDIVAFQYGRTTSHLGIMISKTQFVHARMDFKKVVINTLNTEFTKRLTHAYKFPGVDNV